MKGVVGGLAILLAFLAALKFGGTTSQLESTAFSGGDKILQDLTLANVPGNMPPGAVVG